MLARMWNNMNSRSLQVVIQNGTATWGKESIVLRELNILHSIQQS